MTTEKERARIKLGVIFLGRKRPGFDPEWGTTMTKRVHDALAKTEFEIVEPPEKVVDDASLCDAIDALERASVDALVALQTTMADARMAPTLHQRWPDPILLWATPENPQGDMISSCSLVGAHNWGSILRHLHHRFEIVYGDPEKPEVIDELSREVRIARTIRTLRQAKVGVIAGTAPGFFAMAADAPTMTKRLGPQVQSFSLQQYADVVQAVGDDEIAADVDRVKALGLPHKGTSDDDLPTASRLYLAFRQLMGDEAIDALAVRCWPEMPNVFKQWPYLGMTRLTEEGVAISMEGDADGAVGALIAGSLGMEPCYISDWLEHDDETITLWHTGNLPFALSYPIGHERGPTIAKHFNFPIPAVVESTLKPEMPITIFRLWHCDGGYLMTACAAETIEPRRHLMGTNGLARLVDRKPHEWFLKLCDAGMPHHVSVCRGDHLETLRQFARVMGIDWVG